MPEIRSHRFATYTAWGILALGVVLRLRQYLANRSLWLDEAMLALNIVNRSFAGLFKPLDYEQGAPLGFLLLEKLTQTLFGKSELALRLLPLLAGCFSLVLFYLVLKRILSPVGLLLPLALFAINPTMIYYTSEVKQYMTDVFIALALFWLAGMEHPRHRIWLTTAGIAALWFSHPALFVLAAIGTVELIQNWKKPIPTLMMSVSWLASLGVLYLVSLRGLSANDFLIDYWREYFLPWPPSIAWIITSTQALFRNPGGLDVSATVLLALAVLGAVILFRREKQTAGQLVLVFVFALATSAIQKYPYAGRMMLFSIPLLFALLGAALDWVGSLKKLPRWLSAAVLLAAAFWILYSPAQDALQKFITPKYAEHIRPTMAYLETNRKSGDVLYVYAWALPAYRFYAQADAPYIAGNLHADNEDLLAELDTLRGQERVWVLMSHVYESGDYNEKDAILSHLDEIGKRKRTFIEPGTSVYLYLYDLSK